MCLLLRSLADARDFDASILQNRYRELQRWASFGLTRVKLTFGKDSFQLASPGSTIDVAHLSLGRV